MGKTAVVSIKHLKFYIFSQKWWKHNKLGIFTPAALKYDPAAFDSDTMIRMDGLQKAAGTYEVKVSPAYDYAWADGAGDRFPETACAPL